MENQCFEESVAETAGAIRPIDKTSVHQICSGQVVLTLATAVKELVENSLDAGATNVEVRLKEYGSESIEVIDNGSGVEEKNYEALTLKHFTSKLTSFSDLTNVETFGFRGEALSSLCALSKLTITTSCTFDGIGMRLEYDHGGKLISKKPSARQHGTSVLVEQLFSTLPVRYKEFQRNLKKEFTKMVQILSAYCIISTGIKLTCTNQTGNGKKSVVLSVIGNSSMKDNIADIYGIKQLESLQEISSALPDERVLAEYELQQINNDDVKLFVIGGFISSCEHGCGRSSTDRQFYFINKRPCDPNKISRLVNEVYHMFNRHQYPLVVLDITLSKDLVDVNVTPDKRQIFFQCEKLLLATIKTSLMKLFQLQTPLCSSVGVSSNVEMSKSKLLKPDGGKESLRGKLPSQGKAENSPLTSILSKLKRSFTSAFDKSSEESESSADQVKQVKIDHIFSKNGNSGTLNLLNETAKEDLEIEKVEESAKEILNRSSLMHNDLETHEDSSCVSSCEIGTSNYNLTDSVGKTELADDLQNSADCLSLSEKSDSDIAEDDPGSCSRTSTLVEDVTEKSQEDRCCRDVVEFSRSHATSDFMQRHTDTLVDQGENTDEGFISLEATAPVVAEIKKEMFCQKQSKKASRESMQRKTKVTITEVDSIQPISKKVVTLNFSMQLLKKTLENQQKRKNISMEIQKNERNFRAGISPSSNEDAETELKKELRKDMFEKMRVIGQFNLGFMIAQLNRDLFIIDQHATDEKFNFEQLEKNTVLIGQRLIQPQKLQLTAVNESILSENLDIFLKNGFEFLINEAASPGDRVLLQSIPTSKNWLFGKDDIEEMIFILSETPGVMCRPSRIQQMLASRACRSSVMIGTALTRMEMKKLIVHMGEIEQPWNCPHGRPTIRHLINLDMVSDKSLPKALTQ